jgi:hypothetical protein
MKKKSLFISLSAVVVIAIIAVVVFVVKPFGANNGENTPTPIPTPTDTIRDIESENAIYEQLANTKQYKEASENENATLYGNGDIKSTHPVYGVLGAWTVNKYIEQAIENPYFITGWWKEKDKYKFDSLQTYVSPYLSTELNDQFKAAAANPESEEFNSFFNGKLSFPDPSLQISPQCYETWDKEACFPIPPRVTEMSIEGVSAKSVKITATVNVQALYQKPDSPDGNLIYQDRDYKLVFTLSEKNFPEDPETELPIMIIDDISATLEIKGNVDYLINVEE